MAGASDLDLDPTRTQELATTLGRAEAEMTGVFTGETGEAVVTLPGTKVPDVATAAIGKVIKAAKTVIADYDALSTTTSTVVTEFQSTDMQNAGDLAAQQAALA
ncbi:hypothetical protein ACFWPX_24050 [Nocardia sp. NPDC058518]|uniref:hypothetical protein n=1 Tax=Nocardia sp. NPDC058518 TaxID=3346534 RepID=UPI00365AF5BC